MQRVIIDCDPGHDDALAILLAAQHLDVLAITTVAGNTTLDHATDNALKILELMGRTDIPVYRGSHAPLLKAPAHAGQIHGATGLAGWDFPAPRQTAEAQHAVAYLVETLRQEDDVWLVPVGPLTNVALAFHQAPEIVERVAGVSLMGGSLTCGNSTPTAEFNIWFDAEAARMVFASGVPIKMFGLNLTHQASATDADIERIGNLGNAVGPCLASLLTHYLNAIERRSGVRKAALHDPCAVAALIQTELIRYEAMRVTVETQGRDTYGMTVCDYRHLRGFGTAQVDRGKPQGKANAEVAMEIDGRGFLELLIDALSRY